MSVKKIFMMLITVVACVMIGAFVLNVLMPNVITTAVNAVEDQLYKATGIKLDLNGDGVQESNNSTYNGTQTTEDNNTGAEGGNVTGFNSGGKGKGGGSAD